MEKEKSLAEIVLDYWSAIEFLSQEKYPNNFEIQDNVRKYKAKVARNEQNYKSIETFIQLTKQGLEKNIYDIISKEARLCGMKNWGNLTFYIGKVKREKCIESIAKYVADELPKGRPEKATDSIAVASFQLTPTGKYIEKSLSISPVIWTLHKLKSEKGNLSKIISSENYYEDIIRLENQYFDEDKTKKSVDEEKKVDKAGEGTDSEGTFQKFDTNAVEWNDIKKLYDYILNKYIKDNINVTEEGNIQEVYGISFQLFLDEKAKELKEDDNYLGLSHDYFSNDIKLVLEKIKYDELQADGYMGDDLHEYIEVLGKKNDDRERIDLVNPQDKDILYQQLAEILSIENAPLGKWPSKFMPAFMQQVAINFAINKGKTPIFSKNGKVFSVNGPPGTGKTTLLKEIVVNNIVERAIVLAKYDDPDDVFESHMFINGKKEENAYSSYTRRWYSLKDDEVNNYSMLVTSCNNSAVENISKELPQSMIKDLKPLDGDSEELKEMLEQVSKLYDINCTSEAETTRNGEEYADIYFSKYAAKLLNQEDVWGMIAAPLGNKTNIKSFYYNALKDLLYDNYVSTELTKKRVQRYRESRDRFLAQIEIVKGIQAEIAQAILLQKQVLENKEYVVKIEKNNNPLIEEKQLELKKLQDQQDCYNNSMCRLIEKIDDINTAISNEENGRIQLEKEVENLSSQITFFYEKKIATYNQASIFTKLFRRKKYETILELANEYEGELNKRKNSKDILEESLVTSAKLTNNLEMEIKKMKSEKVTLEKQIDRNRKPMIELENEIKKLQIEIEKARAKYEQENLEYQSYVKKVKTASMLDTYDIFDEQYVMDILSKDNERATMAQVKNPWLSQRYNREREKLFAYAMIMNKNFVLASKACRDNLITLSHYWGVRPGDDKKKIVFSIRDIEEMVPSLFQTLFLLVPVISSTFASVGTLFKDIKHPGLIGLLIVDEAGQAQPQMAVGALYRSRRAVIVGDPKQVEPVVTDDLDLLKKAYVDERLGIYKTKNLSVQIFADKLNSYGTYLENGSDYPDWVGAPLLVHRRCISPMYDISNRLSYNGLMKQQTNLPSKELEEKFILNKSCWINVVGSEYGNKNHFVKEQGEKVCELLEKAFSKNTEPNLYIISPFTTVAGEIKRYINDYCKCKPRSNINVEYINNYKQKRIGTVHTFQGKEANEVIFLLGCDCSEDAKGAINWVNDNIVNVAVTRAKYRLYVIGDECAWKESSCISLMKKYLEVVK